jgi:hypothetical protein
VAKGDPFGGRRDLEPAALIGALERFEVDYVVIGGLAAIAYGAQRITQDLDIAIDRSPHNCRRLIEALASLDAEICLDARRRTALTERADPAWLAERDRFFDTRAGGVDVRHDVPGAPPYERLRQHAGRYEPLPGLRVTVAGRDDLIAMKRATARDQDLADIREIEAAAYSATHERELDDLGPDPGP